MKKKLQFLFSVMVLMCLSVVANAQDAQEPEFSYQKYLVQNVASGMYWAAGNSWGTQASLVVSPEYLKLEPVMEGDPATWKGTYYIESQVNQAGHYFNGDFMDQTPPVEVIVKAVEGGYTIANGTNYYGWDGSSTVLGKNLAADSPNAVWTIVSLADAKAGLSAATAEKPIDATFLIEDHDFGRNNRYQDRWIVSDDCTNKNLSGGNNTNNCVESFHSVFTISQALDGAPAGIYALAAQGFYRQDGTDDDNLPVIFANDETSTFPLKTGSEGGMGDASASFSAGKYAIDPVFVEVPEGGSLTVGAKLVTNTNLWCIWDNFTLKYYGTDANIEQLKNAALFEEVAELKTQAEGLVGQIENNAVLTALQGAIASAEGVATADAAKEAKTALTNAITKANNYLSAKAAIDAHYAVLNSTNIATAEATETYKGLIDGWNEANEAGTLTETVKMPSDYGWHVANPIDDFLLSAWSVGETKCQDYDAPMYINTWSTEGNADGSEFRVPFFEYWTNDDKSLGANDLTATLEGITEGNYAVEAFVRVRMKDAATAPAYGITLQANDGEAANVCDGTQFGSQFFVKNVRVPAVVGADGKLVVKFSVAADNNISWLSFQDVKYITAEEAAQKELDENYAAAQAAIQDGNYYEISTKVGETTYYLKMNDANTGAILTADEAEATAFQFTAQKAASSYLYENGWNLGVQFTNPNTTNGKGDGAPKNEGFIRRDGKNNRDTWERQVFFLNADGEYAVRSTNAAGSSWCANTFWDVVDTEATPAVAGYGTSISYVWNLTDVTEKATIAGAAEELAAAQAVVNAKQGVGDALFFIPEEAYNTYAGAVAAAAAIINNPESTDEQILQAVADLRAATATYEATEVAKPVAGKAYVVANATAEGNLAVTTEKVSVETDAFVYFTEVEGGYAISNENGEYIFKTTGNTWTLSSTENLAEAYVLTVVPVAGGYTLKGANGLIGLDGTAAGSSCYANKAQSNNGLWTISEYVAPVIADLTADMFHKWTLVDPIEVADPDQKDCAFGLFKTTGDVYGDMSVKPNMYADLTEYDYLTIAGVGGVPRLIFNRTADLTQEEGSEAWKGTIPLQIQDTESPYIVSAENDIYVYDLAKIKEFLGGTAHLNCIKVASFGQMTPQVIKVSTQKPFIPTWYTITPATELENGTVASTWEKAVEGAPVPVTATPNEDFELEGITYTAAGSEAPVAVEGNTFTMPAANVTISATFTKAPEYVYTDLTADMFFEWTSPDAGAEEVGAGGCAYVLDEATSLPYGNGSVVETQYADLSEYTSLTLTLVGEGTPRLLFNTVGATDPKTYLEINAEGTYARKQAIEGGNKWIIDLAKITEDKGFAHLNCIKANGWGNNITVSEMELAALVQVPEIALNSPIFNFEEGTQAEPNIQPAGSKLTINWSAENLEENLVTEDAVQVKMTVMVTGDLPENLMTMGSSTAHRVLGETFYVGLGEQDFPVELKPGYVYQNIAVMAAELVLPGDEETPEVSLAAYAGEPIQLHWVGIAAEEEEGEQEIAIERTIGQGYAAQAEEMDFSAAEAYLGVDAITNSMLRVVKSDETLDDTYAPYDGWFTKDGFAQTWGANAFVNVKLWEANDEGNEGKYTICDMGGDQGTVAPVAGDVAYAKWAAVANDKTFYFNFKITFVEAETPEIAISEIVIQSEVTYDVADAEYAEKEIKLSDADVTAILDELGLTSLEDATVYGYNPSTKELVSNYASYDGWRDANGDFHTWSNDGTVTPYCLKYVDGQKYLAYNRAGQSEQSQKVYWAIANATKAVLVEFTFTYEDVVGIAGVGAGKAKVEGRKYMENGNVVIFKNGKKFSVTGAELNK